MKSIIKNILLIMLLFLISCNVYAKSNANYEESVKNTDVYIKEFRDYDYYIDNTNKYLYNGSLSSVDKFKHGGFINTYEFNLTKNKDYSYLITGSRYFTMTESENKVDFINIVKIDNTSKNSNYESKITEYVIPETRVIGTGTRNVPWMFLEPKFKVTINLVNATINGKNKIEETIIGYSKSYFMKPSKDYYIFKNLDGDLTCNSNVESYSVNGNRLLLKGIKGDTVCNVKFRGISVTANITVNNGKSVLAKITGEAGDNLSTGVSGNFGYAYDNVNCTNSQSASYLSKKITVNNITRDTTCIVNYIKPDTIYYDYIASNQVFTAKYDGYYKVDSYGARGENGGVGAFASGIIYLNKGESLIINTGGTYGYNGGGSGLHSGGGATTIRKNNTILIAAAGGGGGKNGTVGGNDTGKGGASSGGSGTNGGAGRDGINAGGGGSGYNYTYTDTSTCSNCYYGENTCRGGYEDVIYKRGSGKVCTTCHNGKYGTSYDSTSNVNCGSNRKEWECGSWPACGNSGKVCKSCSAYCIREEYNNCLYGHNTCRYGCATATKSYNSGKGGTNIFNQSVLSKKTTSGISYSNGKANISFYNEEY